MGVGKRADLTRKVHHDVHLVLPSLVPHRRKPDSGGAVPPHYRSRVSHLALQRAEGAGDVQGVAPRRRERRCRSQHDLGACLHDV